ncbi:hypothetical protein [Clostridium folliculivorans]|uniref:hypothetical protein n=1 Tax=Clostridium folliculivorans TaxID=2886038 RepID=UPI0021C25710|nr:hypothetical protein [Clostridium folliculivorans]GKU31643.1 hypothetical protein CFB3_37500 [Clostridium folliculivorans]
MNYSYRKILFFTYVNKENYKDINEGGLARFLGLYKYLESICAQKKYIRIDRSCSLLTRLARVYINLLFTKRCLIILQYPSLGIPIFGEGLISTALRKIFLKLIELCSVKNRMYIDVADLPYEQSRDLEINSNTGFHIFKDIESAMFNLKNAKYMFASYSMRDYICTKYNLDTNKAIVCINGGHKIQVFDEEKYKKIISEKNINYIYAGTLNKGRQIEEIINIFKKCPMCNLILIGINGEWIEQENLSSNIQYLGSLQEEEAHKLTSMCDVGIIPYDSSRFYYNIAYPTKLSFYVTAGITFLSTKVSEVQKINERYDVGYTLDIEKWGQFINTLSKEEINNKKQEINLVKENFYWDNIFKAVNLMDDILDANN